MYIQMAKMDIEYGKFNVKLYLEDKSEDERFYQ